ncbi:MAG: hypothetical protein OXF84_01000 [Bacteroidetes bacterium]|nr:hypothetical protein [Bacteroidota bacterium]
MPSESRHPDRFNRVNQQRPPSMEATALETLTVEEVLYEIELIHHSKWVLGHRKGHSWYSEDGTPLAEAAQIKAIRIPARQH